MYDEVSGLLICQLKTNMEIWFQINDAEKLKWWIEHFQSVLIRDDTETEAFIKPTETQFKKSTL